MTCQVVDTCLAMHIPCQHFSVLGRMWLSARPTCPVMRESRTQDTPPPPRMRVSQDKLRWIRTAIPHCQKRARAVITMPVACSQAHEHARSSSRASVLEHTVRSTRTVPHSSWDCTGSFARASDRQCFVALCVCPGFLFQIALRAASAEGSSPTYTSTPTVGARD